MKNQKKAYRKQDQRTHFVTGIVAGAAVAYLLSQKQVRDSIGQTGQKAWSAVRGEVEELKERLEDAQAELAMHRQNSQTDPDPTGEPQ
ncbi:YtxH domain-containing protein [Ferrimonas pelagia]|uniref:YtxH domain-containing protein n=1 Tax=Ferrimonas pelagia TaxID=1177826 RepID=A0ABP9F6H8_9GAMM